MVVFCRVDKALPVGDIASACWRSTWFSDSRLENFSSYLIYSYKISRSVQVQSCKLIIIMTDRGMAKSLKIKQTWMTEIWDSKFSGIGVGFIYSSPQRTVKMNQEFLEIWLVLMMDRRNVNRRDGAGETSQEILSKKTFRSTQTPLQT